MKSLVSLAILSCCILLSGCGGGTIGSGLGIGSTPIGTSYGDHSDSSYNAFRLTGHITNAQGKPLPFARVKAISNAGELSTEANRLGEFNLDIKISSGEMVTFEVTYGKTSWSLTTDVSPAGRNIIPVEFKVYTQGRLDAVW